MIKFFRLVTGEDIICRIVKSASPDIDSDEILWYMVEDSMKVVYLMNNEKNIPHVGLMPWILPGILNNNSVTININDIMICEDVHPELIELYEKVVEYFNENTAPKYYKNKEMSKNDSSNKDENDDDKKDDVIDFSKYFDRNKIH